MASVAAIVPAAGAGRRFGGRGNKLFVPLAGKPLLAHALLALQRSAAIRWIIVVTAPRACARVIALAARYRISKLAAVCAGGPSRSASVALGLARVPAAATHVAVHDGARPCVTPAVIARTAAAAMRRGAAVCAMPAVATVKQADARGRVVRTLDRSRLWLMQTPQIARVDWLRRALARSARRLETFPDDAAALEAAGYPVHLVAGDAWNIKVTTRRDLALAEAILRR